MGKEILKKVLAITGLLSIALLGNLILLLQAGASNLVYGQLERSPLFEASLESAIALLEGRPPTRAQTAVNLDLNLTDSDANFETARSFSGLSGCSITEKESEKVSQALQLFLKSIIVARARSSVSLQAVNPIAKVKNFPEIPRTQIVFDDFNDASFVYSMGPQIKVASLSYITSSCGPPPTSSCGPPPTSSCGPPPTSSCGPTPTTTAAGCPAPTTSSAGCPIPTTIAAGCLTPTTSSAGCPIPTTTAAGCLTPTTIAAGCPIPTTSSAGCPIPTTSSAGCLTPTTSSAGCPSCGPVLEPPQKHTVGMCNSTCQEAAPVQVSGGQADICFNYLRPVTVVAGFMSPDFTTVWWLNENCYLSTDFVKALEDDTSLSCLSLVLPSEVAQGGYVFWLVTEGNLSFLDWTAGIYELKFYNITR